jgi:ribosomal protein S18 acetylase RimI-like enzyme
MFLRPASLNDAEGIDAVRIRAWNETYRGMMPDAFLDAFSKESHVEAWRKRLTPPLDRTTFSVAVGDSGAIVGFAVCGPAREETLGADGEIYAINLVMQATRLGLGTRLMEAMAEGLIGNGFAGVALWVLEQNIGARWFYERLGGSIATRRERDFGGKMLTEFAYVWHDVSDLKQAAERVLAS